MGLGQTAHVTTFDPPAPEPSPPTPPSQPDQAAPAPAPADTPADTPAPAAPTRAPASWRPPEDEPADAVVYGPDIPTEADIRLLGNVEGKRVVQLGAGTGHNAVALARRGARTIVVDPSPEAVADARRRCERDEVRVEFHESDLAELAFLRADTVDAVLSAWALSGVPDLNRVFRQAHRVLKTESPLVFSVPHPAFAMVAQHGERTVVDRSYFDREPLEDDGEGTVVHHHTINDLFTALIRANFRVDALVEPEPSPGGPRSSHWTDAFRLVPRTLVVRARKEGL